MNKMFRLLRADEIECRVSTVSKKGISVLLYKDARVDQNLLDEVVGPSHWQRRHDLINGNLFCSVGIWSDMGDGSHQWIWKQDVGTESRTEKEKGQASDSFKRACFNWGIGRELYTAPFIWIPAEKVRMETDRNGRPTTKDRFKVAAIDYDDEGVISLLDIVNVKTAVHVYRYRRSGKTGARTTETAQEGNYSTGKEKRVSGDSPVTEDRLTHLKMFCAKNGVPESDVAGIYGKESLADVTVREFEDFKTIYQDFLNAWKENHEGAGETAEN